LFALGKRERGKELEEGERGGDEKEKEI